MAMPRTSIITLSYRMLIHYRLTAYSSASCNVFGIREEKKSSVIALNIRIGMSVCFAA